MMDHWIRSMAVSAVVGVCGWAGGAPAQVPVTQPVAETPQWTIKPQERPPIDQVVAQAQHNPRIYGLYTWAEGYGKNRAAINAIGWRAIRQGGPIKDEIVRAYAEDDMEVLLTLSGRRFKLGEDDGKEDQFVADYVQLLTERIGRYGPGGQYFRENPAVPNRPIRHWEIWNEPNFQYMIPPDKRPAKEMEALREKLYARLLPAAYDAAKRVSDQVQVVGFGAGGAGAGDMRFIRNVHENDPRVARSYDILGTHPYVDPAPPEAFSMRSWGAYSIPSSLAEIRKTLAGQNRGDTPIWYTEIGWPISQKDGGHFADAPNRVYISPMLQAAYVCRLYATALRLNVERVHVMFTTDTDNFNGGFFLRDGSWRPSAYAVQTMTHLLPSPRLLGAIRDGDDGFYAYRFAPLPDKAARPVIMAWHVKGPNTLRIPFDAPQAVVTDMMGTKTTINAERGELVIEIGPLPVYVTPSGN